MSNDNKSRENTDLERRVLAHEQILQALIAYMVESDPEMLKRMTAAFSNPVRLDHTGDYTDTAAYAARFVREVIRLGRPEDAAANVSLVALWDDLWPTSGEANLLNENVPVRFEINKRDDLWEVTRDGRLSGGYVSQKGALEAAHIAMQDIFCAGGSAELIARQTANQATTQTEVTA
jgi:hypothetical protein